MPRPPRPRRICAAPAHPCFVPEGCPNANRVILTLDEFEVLRLVDFEKRTHGQCAAQMDISRTTVTEIYESARFKLADSLVNGKRIEIAGGCCRICDGSGEQFCGKKCQKAGHPAPNEKGEHHMRIAVTHESGNIFQHFGHAAQFKIYEVIDNKIVHSEVVDTNGSGHGALAGFLVMQRADAVICGGIGGGAQAALDRMGVKLYGGCTGGCDEAVQALIDGRLSFDPNVRCSHHDHAHGEAEHTCGEHGCGGHDDGHACHCH